MVSSSRSVSGIETRVRVFTMQPALLIRTSSLLWVRFVVLSIVFGHS